MKREWSQQGNTFPSESLPSTSSTSTTDVVSSKPPSEDERESLDDDMEFDHKVEMKKCARDLQALYESSVSDYSVPKSVSDFDNAQRDEDNPLAQSLPLKCQNIFIDTVRFAMKHNRELIHTILRHTANNHTVFDESMVIHVAKIYSEMSSKYNYKNNTLKKLHGTVLQSCGTTDIGMYILNKLGDSESSRRLLETRSMLASVDE